MHKYGLATILEDVPVGYEFYQDNIPLHLTHIDSFQVSLDARELEYKLKSLLLSQKIITNIVKDTAHYGPNIDIPVAELELTDELSELHLKLILFLEGEGAIFTRPNFLKDNYRPHVTELPNIKLLKGEQVNIPSISIAAKESIEINPKTKILATILFDN